jgi:hypothetical protein
MMSCTASAAWSHPVLLLCCTEHSQHCGAVLSGHITTVAMFRSGQLGMHCTVEPNCSVMSARLVGTSVTRDRALDTCEPSCEPGIARPFFIPVVHSPLGAVEYVATPRPHGSAGAHLGRETRSGAEEHVAALELFSQGGRAQSHGTRGSVGAHLYREVWSEATTCVAARGCTPCSLS